MNRDVLLALAAKMPTLDLTWPLAWQQWWWSRWDYLLSCEALRARAEAGHE
jgi:hypothetical protein